MLVSQNHRSKTVQLSTHLVVVWIGWFMVPAVWNQVCADEGATPSWKQGVSIWNGKGYDTSPISDETLTAPIRSEPARTTPEITSTASSGSDFHQTSTPAPYTVPVDPALAAPIADPSTPYADLSGMPEKTVVSAREKVIDKSTVRYNGFGRPIEHSDLPMDGSHDAMPADGNIKTIGPPSPSDLDANDPNIYDQNASDDQAVGDQSHMTPTMADVLDAGDAVIETLPLQQEQGTVRWYQHPANWIKGSWMKGWDSHAEFGLDGSSGNADTLALQTGLELRRQTDLYTIAVDIDYRNARSQNVTIEDNGRYNLDVDRLIKGSPWSSFGKFGLEWDTFKAFDLRLNLNGGLGYHFLREDDASLAARFGAGASKEIGAPDDDWVAEAVFGLEGMRQINSRHKVKAKLDYFPAWEDFGDYRLVADASWEILLDDTDNFSLKLAATDRFDSTPQGARRNDVYYSLLLLYKF